MQGLVKVPLAGALGAGLVVQMTVEQAEKLRLQGIDPSTLWLGENGGGNVYVRALQRMGGGTKPKMVMVARILAGVQGRGEKVEYLNGNQLDLTGGNLVVKRVKVRK